MLGIHSNEWIFTFDQWFNKLRAREEEEEENYNDDDDDDDDDDEEKTKGKSEWVLETKVNVK